MSKQAEQRAYDKGHADGVLDTVRQDRERMKQAMLALMLNINNIIGGKPHDCGEAGDPADDGRCWSCNVIAFTSDAAIGRYQRALDAIANAGSGARPTE